MPFSGTCCRRCVTAASWAFFCLFETSNFGSKQRGSDFVARKSERLLGVEAPWRRQVAHHHQWPAHRPPCRHRSFGTSCSTHRMGFSIYCGGYPRLTPLNASFSVRSVWRLKMILHFHRSPSSSTIPEQRHDIPK